jgi:hypothetical protein
VKRYYFGKYCKDTSTGWYVAWDEPKSATITAYKVGYDDGFGDIDNSEDGQEERKYYVAAIAVSPSVKAKS